MEEWCDKRERPYVLWGLKPKGAAEHCECSFSRFDSDLSLQVAGKRGLESHSRGRSPRSSRGQGRPARSAREADSNAAPATNGVDYMVSRWLSFMGDRNTWGVRLPCKQDIQRGSIPRSSTNVNHHGAGPSGPVADNRLHQILGVYFDGHCQMSIGLHLLTQRGDSDACTGDCTWTKPQSNFGLLSKSGLCAGLKSRIVRFDPGSRHHSSFIRNWGSGRLRASDARGHSSIL